MGYSTTKHPPCSIAALFLALAIAFALPACDNSDMGAAGWQYMLTGTCEPGTSTGETTTGEHGIVWVKIPAGCLLMGCSENDDDCDGDEMPAHEVGVYSFEMTETETTQAQYKAVTGKTPSHHSGCSDCPVEYVHWDDAREFCEAVGGRLPSEAEWEYAARGGTTTRYYCGDDSECLKDIAWYGDNSDGHTHPVKMRFPNDYGLWDMLGNVREWTEDCLHGDYEQAPYTGGVWEGGDCTYRVVRGGSWGNGNPGNLRASYRYGLAPDGSRSYIGFRCVRSSQP